MFEQRENWLHIGELTPPLRQYANIQTHVMHTLRLIICGNDCLAVYCHLSGFQGKKQAEFPASEREASAHKNNNNQNQTKTKGIKINKLRTKTTI